MNSLDLLPHNKRASIKVQEKFEKDNLAALVHATGTGKTFVFLDLALQNPNKKFLFLAPSISIIEHVKETIKENNLDIENIEFRTYQSLVNMSNEELTSLEMDYLVLDEFHHIGAPIWGNRIQEIINTHPNLKILAMSAYTVRNRGRGTERDLTNPFSDEMFSGHVVSTYTLSSAIVDKVLPLIKYKSAYIDYHDDLEKIKRRFSQLKKGTDAYNEVYEIINRLDQNIKYARNMGDIFKENIKPDGKYFYFCPMNRSGKDEYSIESIKETVRKWIHEMGLTDDDYVFYESTDEMGADGKKNRDAFYHDTDLEGNPVNNKLRIMFAINQYNEGVHAPNVDGVIMGRDTKSDIVFYEQLGRALSVIGKDSIVIDLAGNIEYMYSLQDKINREVARKKQKENDDSLNLESQEESFEFDIGLMNVDILNLIKECEARLGLGFYDNYKLAKNYYEHYGNLLIPTHFPTFDGINKDDDGIELGYWIRTIRKTYKDNKLSMDKIRLLNNIKMVWDNIDIEENWLNNYKLASLFYNHYDHLEVPVRFKTKDGIHFDEDGIALGVWIKTQRTAYSGKTAHKITPAKIQLLNDIGMRWGAIDKLTIWKSKYYYAKEYYLENGNLEVPDSYKCPGGFNLRAWLKHQKNSVDTLSEEQLDLLSEINFNFEKKNYTEMWNIKYEIYKKYVEFYEKCEVPSGFRTSDGINYDEKGIYLDVWYNYQFKRFEKGILDDTQQALLEDLGVEFPRDRH